MALAKDEVFGLVIALAIGGSALGLYGYRQLRPASTPVEAAAETQDESSQHARETFAEALEVAFVNDGADAAVGANDAVLEIKWFPCSKPMLVRLLRKKSDALTKRVREASGLSIDKLRALGFTQVTCDNTRGTTAVDDLAPRKRR